MKLGFTDTDFLRSLFDLGCTGLAFSLTSFKALKLSIAAKLMFI